ncbi:WD repeat-containing protein 76 isoform X2 [Hydra vulgaris]|uniref:WD repeat-containing protein 76 n=1 Tax=Hydra vulgaris TaxID=6087 RepID=A0ABM4C2G6_HYDVU
MPKVRNVRTKAVRSCINGNPYQTKKPNNQPTDVISIKKESNGCLKTDCDIKSDESDYEEFDATQYKLSEYESTRIENIHRNKQILQSFNILEAKEQYNFTKPRTEKKKSFDVGLKRMLNEKIPLPRRVSLRIKNLPVSYTDLPPIEPSRQNTYFSPRRAPKLSMQAINISEGHGKSAMESWSKLQNSKAELLSNNVKKFQEETQKLDIKYAAKVTKDRIYSIAIHPSCDKILACAGDKSGNVGIWDVNSTQGKSTEVFLFSPHTQPINCLKFCPTDISKLYSCSFDGSVRVADFSSQQFSEVFSIEENTDRFNYFDWPANKSNTILVASSNGNVLLFDTRTSCIEQSYEIFQKSVRCIDFHPQNEHLFAASSYDGKLATWDLRNLKKDNNKFLSMFQASKTTSTCFFSPGAGDKLLLTSQDDYLRVFNVDQVGNIDSPRWQVKHDNFTGRWLTTFRACWDPKTENCFVCGSMERPRQIDMFGCMENGLLSHFSITSEEQTTVASVNAFHPSQNILVSGNASGKIYVWM